MKKKLQSAVEIRRKEIMSHSKISKLGLTEGELKEYLGDLALENFGLWIDGQTCAVVDGHSIVYPDDIDQFASHIKFPTPDLWD